MSRAEEYFKKWVDYSISEDEIEDELLKCLGADPNDVDTWPCEDFSFDHYDNSFEIEDAKHGWTPTWEQLHKCFELGFSRCWINYKAEGHHGPSEKYFEAGTTKLEFMAWLGKKTGIELKT